MPLLDLGHALVEQRGLREMIGERLAAHAHLVAFERLVHGLEAAAGRRGRRLARPAAARRIRFVRCLPDVDRLPVHRIALVVRERAHRPVDRYLVKVRAAEPAQLRIGVREQAPLQQRIVREVDAGHHVPRMKRDLLGLREEVVGIAVQCHPADGPHRHQLFRHQLGRVEQVEVELAGIGRIDHLHAEFELRIVAALDRHPQVAPVEVRVMAGNPLRLVPQQRIRAAHGPPVELHESLGAGRVHEAERVHAETVHRAKARGQRAVGHQPQHHVGGFRHQRHEIPERVVRGRAGRHLVRRLGLHRMHEVGKLDRILDEEHRHVVADEVVVALFGIELHREAPHVAHGIGRPARPLHRRETHVHRRFGGRVLQERGLRVVGHRLVHAEHAVRGRAARMHHALRNALVIEMRDLLAHDEVFEQRRAARAAAQRVLVVGDPHALVGAQCLVVGPRAVLVELARFRAVLLLGGRRLAG